MKFSFTVENDKVLSREFKNVAESFTDFSDAFRAALPVFRESIQDNFQSNNTTGKSGAWQPLSAAYEEQKVRKLGFLGFVTLERLTDALYDSLTKQAAHSVVEISDKEAAFGTDLPYAKAQHFGHPPRNLPSRPLIDLSDTQLKSLGDAMKKAIVGKVKREATLIELDTDVIAEFGDIL